MQLSTFSYKLALITYSLSFFSFFLGAVAGGNHKVCRDHLRYAHMFSTKSRLLFFEQKNIFSPSDQANYLKESESDLLHLVNERVLVHFSTTVTAVHNRIFSTESLRTFKMIQGNKFLLASNAN